MPDIYFWISITKLIKTNIIQKDLQILTEEIKNSENQLNLIKQKILTKQNEENRKIRENLENFENQIREKKNSIFKLLINSTLEFLKITNENYLNKKKFDIFNVKSSVVACRLIIEKAEKEYNVCSCEEEKKLYVILKIFAHKCLSTIMKKTEEIIQISK